jgi:hypothetical protein
VARARRAGRAARREDALPYGSAGTVLARRRAIGSAGERLVHTEEVTGSIPVSPTRSAAISILVRITVGAIPVAKRSANLYAAAHDGQARLGAKTVSTSITQGTAATLRLIGIVRAAGVV